MECTAICRICGVTITCKDGNIYTLGEHLLKKHPELEMTHFTMEECGDGPRKSKSRQKTQRKLSNKFSFASTFLRKSSTLLRGRKHGATRRSLYKTTVESWRPGTAALSCPKCGHSGQPYIRKQRNKVAYNSLGAFFLLGCWPLCFLPMLMCGGTNTIICCKKCGYCFGTYDKKKGKLIPATKDIKVETPNVC
ncbi:uncharacterized protein [Tenebrio molitor]|uniref:uncharacterized protein n=1 Tax=Tenebrio molitor TaxID=7067 RepID=UPI001C397040|nr:unnamed protein product [Tenebrio molitor]